MVENVYSYCNDDVIEMTKNVVGRIMFRDRTGKKRSRVGILVSFIFIQCTNIHNHVVKIFLYSDHTSSYPIYGYTMQVCMYYNFNTSFVFDLSLFILGISIQSLEILT